jgi:hypothetical protein
VSSASGPYFMFCAPVLVFRGTEGVRSRFNVLLPGLIFGGTEGVGSRFHVKRARTRFWRYRGRRVSFLCFALLDWFSAVPRAFDPVFMFCALGLIFGGTKGVGSRFHVLHARARFQHYRGHRVPFSCFACPDLFSALWRASGPVFVFCAPELIFGGAEGVGSHFHVLRSRTHFRRYRGHRVPFSCFALPDSFSTLPMTSGPVFMFCAPELVFDSTDDVGSCFHVLRVRTRIRRYGGRRVPI